MPFHPVLEAFFEEKNAKLEKLKVNPQNIVSWEIVDFDESMTPNTTVRAVANRYTDALGTTTIPQGKVLADGEFTRTVSVHRRHVRDVMFLRNVIDNTNDIVGTVEITDGQTPAELADEFGTAISLKWNINSDDLVCAITSDNRLSVRAKKESLMYFGQVYITGLTIST